MHSLRAETSEVQQRTRGELQEHSHVLIEQARDLLGRRGSWTLSEVYENLETEGPVPARKSARMAIDQIL